MPSIGTQTTFTFCLLAGALLSVLAIGCDGAGSDTGIVTLKGSVTYANNEEPVPDARIEVPATQETVQDDNNATGRFTARTDAKGQFRLDVEIESSTELTVRAIKGELSDEQTVTVFPDEPRTGINLVLNSQNEGGGGAIGGDTTTVRGRVTNASGDPIQDARVAAQPNAQTVSDQPVTSRTSADGSYDLSLSITGGTELTLSAMRDERQTQKTITVFPDTIRENVDFVFGSNEGGQGENGGGGSVPSDEDQEAGTPSNILLQNVSRTTIGVKQSGAPEVSRISFQVADSAGRPVSLDNETPVTFKIGQKPIDDPDRPIADPDGDGDTKEVEKPAFIAPQQATTNDNGSVTVNLSSGTVSGTVQIVASANTQKGGTIRSKPVAVTIHGGFPDDEHFGIGPASYNFQGLTKIGLEMPISVVVGDRYSNPVKPGSAVYFKTDNAVIEGSIETDEQGRGTVQLISGEPDPPQGVAVITASTANRNGGRIETQAPVLFSGAGDIKVRSIPSQNFDPALDMRNPQDVQKLEKALGSNLQYGGYDFTVRDRNKNPLPGGTTITFNASGTEVAAGGDVGTTLGDTRFVDQNGDNDKLDYEDIVRGPGITTFSGSAVKDDNPETPELPDLKSISFSFNAPQSQLTVTFSEDAGNQANPKVMVSDDGEPVLTVQDGNIIRP